MVDLKNVEAYKWWAGPSWLFSLVSESDFLLSLHCTQGLWNCLGKKNFDFSSASQGLYLAPPFSTSFIQIIQEDFGQK